MYFSKVIENCRNLVSLYCNFSFMNATYVTTAINATGLTSAQFVQCKKWIPVLRLDKKDLKSDQRALLENNGGTN